MEENALMVSPWTDSDGFPGAALWVNIGGQLVTITLGNTQSRAVGNALLHGKGYTLKGGRLPSK